MASPRPAIGVFWGDCAATARRQSKSTSALPPVMQPTQTQVSQSRKRAKEGSPRRGISLPDLQNASSTQLIAVADAWSKPAHASTMSLLAVLQTLWRSIAKDTYAFVQQITEGKELRVADRKHLRAAYYNAGVCEEDRPYFLHERQEELHREAVRHQTTLNRELHCAPEDRQYYHFDRRRKTAGKKALGRKPTTRDNKKNIEDRLIDRHDHKIQHLLNVLQTEMANETQREIRAVSSWNPQRALSRQSKRQIGMIVKERYEAADRIMRILEEYHIVIGVDAARYLEATIAEGKAVVDRQLT